MVKLISASRNGWRVVISVFILVLIGSFLNAQRPYWEMMQDSIVDYDATVRAFEEYWRNKTPEKGSGYNVFKRWEHLNSYRRRPDGTLPPVGYEAAEMERWEAETGNQRRTNAFPNGNWTPMGPIALPTNNVGQPGGIGRLTTMTFHPTNPSILYAGAPAGGLWVSTNNGGSWTTQTDFLPTLGVSSILIHPINPNIMYIGTGDKDGGDASGLGVYKSVDGGITWTVSNTGMGTRVVHTMAFDPNNSSTLIASTSNGIYRSINDGANWTQVLASGTTYELRYRAGSNNIVYAVNATRFYKSTDDGATWDAGTIVSTSARAAFALTAADPDLIYMVKNVGANPVFKSTDAGVTWVNIQTDGKLLLNGSCSGTGTGGQGWYDICISIDPTNSNIVIVGGVSLWKSIDGGATFNIYACWSSMVTNVHADHHWLAVSPHHPNRLYICNDGGMYYTDNSSSTFTNISSGLAVSQIYRVAVSGNRTDIVTAGLQDNGMLISRQPNWFITVGGDGLECAIDPTDNSYQYGSYVNGVIRRSLNGGYNWSTISGSIPETGPWLTPYTLQPGNPNVMLSGYISLWRSTNVKAGTPTWTNVQTFTTSTIRDIHFGDGNTVYFSRSNGEFWQSLDAGITWTQKTNPPGGTADDIAADPANPNTVWVASGTNVYRSVDGGTTWAIWDTGLPNVEALSVVYDRVANALYAGMWTGVYYRGVGDASWVPYKNNLPNTQALHLQIFYDQSGCVGRDMLRLATYGRGLWESDLRAGSTLAPVACFGVTPTTSPCAGTQVVTFTDSSGYDPTAWLWTITGPGTVTFTGGTSNTSQNPQVIFGSAGLYSVTLQATNGNGTDIENRVNYINVILPPVSFTSPDSLIYAGQTATFTSNSTPCATSWLWDFGDGNTSTLQNPVHSYAVPGLYTVTLTINGGVNSLSRTNYIQVLPHFSVPYTSVSAGWTGDMENDALAWHFGDKRMSGTVNNYERGSVTLTFPAAASGTKCWATDLDANVAVASYSTAVYSPTFDLSLPGKYQVRLKTAMQSVWCNAPLGAMVQYTTNLGATWTRLGGKQGTDVNAVANWYDKGGTGGCDNADVVGTPFIAWNNGSTTFRQAIYDASALAGNARVGFRVAFYSSQQYGAFVSKGFAFDDFEIDYAPVPVVTDTIPGSLVNFDGVDDFVETYYGANTPVFSIEGWVMSPTSPTNSARTSIAHKNSVFEFNWNHPTAASRGAFCLRNTGGTWQNYSFGPLLGNTWYHLAVTFDGSTVRTYKNGLLVTSAAFAGSLTTNANNMQLGSGGGAFFNGQLDEFRMWSTVRTQQEIREAMHRTLDPAECTGIVMYYQSNEPSGYLRDAINLRNGYLQGGLGRTLSPIAVGRGVSQSLVVTGTGMYNFNLPQLRLNFSAAAGTPFDVTVTRINQFINEQTPNPSWNAAPNATLVDRNFFFYHVVNKFGGTTFTTDAIVEGMPGITPAEALSPTSVKWVKRNSNSVGVWDLGIPAASATVSTGWNGTATFNSVSNFSQAFIGKEPSGALPTPEVLLFAMPDPSTQSISLSWEFSLENDAREWTLEKALQAEDFDGPEIESLFRTAAQNPTKTAKDQDVRLGETWFYRFKSLNSNGQASYSNIVSATLAGDEASLVIYPNPSIGYVNLMMLSKGKTIELQVTDLGGRTLWSDGFEGENGLIHRELNLSTLSKGMYLLNVREGDSFQTIKLGIQ